jgi:phage gp36-like protein
MLHYVTLAEFESEVPMLVQALTTNDAQMSGGIREETYVENKLKASESMVDGYLGTRYTIPVKAEDGTVPEIVKQAVFTIAKYLLFARRNNLTPDIADQYTNTLTWLKDVSAGRADIAVFDADAVLDPVYEFTIITGEENPQIFGGSSL